MTLPPRLRALRDRTLADVEVPDYAWLTWAACAVAPDACGWEGWMLEAAFRRDGQRHATGTGDRLIAAADAQACPRCGRETFRTAASVRVEPSVDQRPVHGRAALDYDVAPESAP